MVSLNAGTHLWIAVRKRIEASYASMLAVDMPRGAAVVALLSLGKVPIVAESELALAHGESHGFFVRQDVSPGKGYFRCHQSVPLFPSRLTCSFFSLWGGKAMVRQQQPQLGRRRCFIHRMCVHALVWWCD